ncbi:MAG TPA: 2-C-methyl-D-erythritol 2,4-cyclodiphosphate synthase [Firmicutes bacterium]|nr:2-C-methyl-D-erythritol 2,4-cyclodiphosphate synthase [Bacillota bacterium]
MQDLSVILVAGGQGVRMGGIKKHLLPLLGVPVLLYSLQEFASLPCLKEVVIVTQPDDFPTIRMLLQDLKLSVPVHLTAGGADRRQSAANGFFCLSEQNGLVAIHDAARPLIQKEDILRTAEAARKYGAAVLAAPVKDTIKIAGEDMVICQTPARETLYAAQTPQIFEKSLYAQALAQSPSSCTDDSQMIEPFHPVHIVPALYPNHKLTTPDDIPLLESLLSAAKSEKKLQEEKKMRIGHGYDVHRLVPGRKLILGGVEIPWENGLLGHSDADVLTHAVMDSLLGAAGLGDIGKHFPDTDAAYQDADSMLLLQHVGRLIREQGWMVGNLDATIIAQAPKLASYLPAMKTRFAEVLQLQETQINLKATTEEHLGFTGAGEGMAAHAVCLLFSV